MHFLCAFSQKGSADMSNEPQYVIEMLHITKEFPGIKANDDITLQLRHGEIHALMGENGAGKSTFIKVITGVRRCGKSCLMQCIAEELRAEGVDDEHIAFFDLDRYGHRSTDEREYRPFE